MTVIAIPHWKDVKSIVSPFILLTIEVVAAILPLNSGILPHNMPSWTPAFCISGFNIRKYKYMTLTVTKGVN